MDLDDIIQRTLKKMADDYEVRRSLYLSTIHKSIDALLAGAPSWFGGDVPPGFQSSIKSLMQISASYSDQIRNFNDFIFDRARETVEISPFLASIEEEILPFTRPVPLNIESDPDISVFVPSSIFRDTLINLIICVLQFAGESTKIRIRSRKVLSSVRISIEALELSPETPELSHLMKPILASFRGSEYRFLIGFELPLYDLKKIGGVVDLESMNGGRNLIITISLPSYSFIQSIEELRSTAEEPAVKMEGEIIVSVDDAILELVLREKLGERGYSVKSYTGEKIRYLPDGSFRAVIVDMDKLQRGLIPEKELQDVCHIIVICGETDKVSGYGTGIRFVSMPFEIDEIIRFIETE